ESSPELFVCWLCDADGRMPPHIFNHLTMVAIVLISTRRIASAQPVVQHRHVQRLGCFYEFMNIRFTHHPTRFWPSSCDFWAAPPWGYAAQRGQRRSAVVPSHRYSAIPAPRPLGAAERRTGAGEFPRGRPRTIALMRSVAAHPSTEQTM